MYQGCYTQQDAEIGWVFIAMIVALAVVLFLASFPSGQASPSAPAAPALSHRSYLC